MSNSIGYNKFINYSRDNEIWREISSEEETHFLYLIKKVEDAIEGGTKKEKGDSLENLMTFIYERFSFVDVISNEHQGDNQIDHIITFVDGMTPAFVIENIGLTLVGESKNHKKSISVREVADLFELLRSKRSKMGIFSSLNSFSKGANSRWANAEGKRRKLSLSTDKIVIGFTLKEIKTLLNGNFYTMMKQKYKSIVDEIFDDYTDENCYLPYKERLENSLQQLHNSKIISSEDFVKHKQKLSEVYGEFEQ